MWQTLWILQFQFHYGTIKSRDFRCNKKHYILYFNSTMVRLKVKPELRIIVPVKFQFHYGTIKSRMHSNVSFISMISIPLWYD